MSDIFISYASEDRSTAQALAKILERQGWSVWWDRNIPIGRSFEEVIEQAISEARCLIVLWSKTSIASDWVRSEAQEGLRKRILVPVLIDDVSVEKIPMSSRRLQAANLTNWVPGSEHAELERLIDSVRSIAPTTVVAPNTSSMIMPAPAIKNVIGLEPNGAGTSNSANKSSLRNTYESVLPAKPSILKKAAVVWSKFRIRWNSKFIFALIALVLSGVLFMYGQTVWEKAGLLEKPSSENLPTDIDSGNIITPAAVSITQKPVIEIIDPPLVLQPGTMPTATLRSQVKEREIIGKADSSAGIISVTVNGIEKTLDHGLFKATVGIKGEKTTVNVVAVDKNGARASLEFLLSLEDSAKANQTDQGSGKSSPGNLWKDIDFGNYHALIIGDQHYKKVVSLDTPITDAKAVDKVLREKYGFTTQLLIDVDRYQILTAMNELRAKLTENDNLLIYYAGHGELDNTNKRGYWLPVDAELDSDANWIPIDAITNILKAMSPRHILLVSDSAYSGAFTRSGLNPLPDLNDEKKTALLKYMLKSRSRVVLTSVDLRPAVDSGGNGHSIFANAFISALQNNNSLMAGQDLYRNVLPYVIAAAEKIGVEQVPQYGALEFAGHKNGDFFFIPK